MLQRYRSYVIDAVLAGAGTTAANANIYIDVSADFYVTHLTATSTGTFSARFRDNSRYSMFWSDQRVNNTLIFGTAQLPFVLPVPRKLAAGSVLFYDFLDTSAGANTVQIVLHGYELIDEKTLTPSFMSGEKLWRSYTLVDETVTANARVVRNIIIDKSPNFVLTAIIASFTSNNFTLMLYNSSDGRFRFSNAVVQAASCVGTAQYPFMLPAPVYMNGSTVMYAELQENSGVNNVIQLILEGYEVQ